MSPNEQCKICNCTAQDVINRWGSAPCLHRLDEANPKCLEHIIREKHAANQRNDK